MDTQVTTADVINAIPEGDIRTSTVDEFTTSNGVRFKVKPVPPFLLMDANKKFASKQPKPPMVPNYDKDSTGAVLEENPSDPDYIAALRAFNTAIGDVANAILLGRGTELISVPEGFSQPDEAQWADDLAELVDDLEIPARGARRYFCWLKYIVLTSMEDFSGLMEAVQSAGGMTTEVDVAVATDDFRGDETRGADPVSTLGSGNGYGHPSDIPISGDSA